MWSGTVRVSVNYFVNKTAADDGCRAMAGPLVPIKTQNDRLEEFNFLTR